jgi:hypothetical protein
LLHL